MKPARFSYEAPETVSAALAALASHGERARVIAGGQSLAPMMNMRIAQPEHLVDINRIPELDGVGVDGASLVCGALTRHAELARHHLVRRHAPLLAFAAGTIGHYAIRQRGTLGGSLAHADPAAQLPVVAVVLDATIDIASAKRRRAVPAAGFFQSLLSTALEPGELLTAVRFPTIKPDESWGFRFFSRRAGDFAVALAACVLSRSGADVTGVRLAVGGVSGKPQRLDHACKAGRGDAAWVAETAKSAAGAALIEDSEHLDAVYRREVVQALVADALSDALERT